MDFGFAPGGRDPHLASLRAMFGRRPATTLIDVRGMTTIRQFIAHLNTTTTITKPIDDAVLGAHANDEGQLFLPSFPGQRGPTVFETLNDTLNDPAKSIAFPDPLIGFKPGDPITHAVHIKGCNIGHAQPLLLKLRQALGGHVRVTAPRFFHGATPAAEGMYEYVGYQFALRRAQPFPNNRTALSTALSEFNAAQFQLIDGTTVRAADWARLIPRNPLTTQLLQVNSRLGVTLGRRTTIRTPRQYRAMIIRFGPWTITYPSAGSVPTSKSAQLLDLKTSLSADPRFDSNHAFPQFRREGFANVVEFVSGYTWNCRRIGSTLQCNGSRAVYTVVLAVTDPKTTPANGFFADGNLIFNFYPAAQSTLAPITNALRVTDPRYFTTV